MKSTHRIVRFSHFTDHAVEIQVARIAIESIVSLSINGESWLEFHCSPSRLDALAAGFLYNEGFIQSIDEILDIKVCGSGDHIDVWLDHPLDRPIFWSRNSGCNDAIQPGGKTTKIAVHPGLMYLQTELEENIDIFYATLAGYSKDRHGIHTSMLLDGKKIIHVIQDIGRHNTLDKLAGICLLQRINLSRAILITTGRISSDMVHKVARMKIAIIISLHSTSERAISTARELGISLIGHACHGRFDAYTNTKRILTGGDVSVS